MVARNKLTTRECETAKPAKKGNRKLADGQRLYLLIKPNGTKTFQMSYTKPDGKTGTLTFGIFPVPCSLALARERRDEALALIDQGLDPQKEKQRVKEQAAVDAATDNTLAFWVRTWCEKQNWADKTRGCNESYLQRFVIDFPTPGSTLGARDVREVTTEHIYAALEAMASAGKFDTLHKVRGMLVTIFAQLPVRRLLEDRNPADHLAREFQRHPKGEGFKMLPLDLVHKFLAKLQAKQEISDLTRAATQLYFLTVPRPDNIRRARWEDFDLEARIWTIPGKMMKGKQRGDHIVPLSDQAVLLLRWIAEQEWTGAEWLFPNHGELRKRYPYISGAVLANVCDAIGFEAHIMRPHGIRKTFSTVMNRLGFHIDAIERCLDHVPGKNDVRAIYNNYQYMDERREIMAFWGFYTEQMTAAKLAPEAVLDAWRDADTLAAKRARG